MKNLSSLLQRFSSLLDKKSLAKEAAVSVIKEVVGITVQPEDVSLNESVLEVSISPAKKSEIMLKSDAILSELKNSKGIHVSRILYK